MEPPAARRPLTTRDKAWAQRLARLMAACGISPNAISLWSIGFSGLGAWALVLAGKPGTGQGLGIICYLAAATAIQLRLLCNLLDGMLAIECGKKSVTGGIYNEAPDRLADVLLLVTAGQTAGPLWGTSLPLGWLAAVLAMGTAYVRALGGTLTGTQNFMGPMAKQHRMFVLTLACLVAALFRAERPDMIKAEDHLWPTVMHLIVLGSAWTCVRRLREIVRLLKAGTVEKS